MSDGPKAPSCGDSRTRRAHTHLVPRPVQGDHLGPGAPEQVLCVGSEFGADVSADGSSAAALEACHSHCWPLGAPRQAGTQELVTGSVQGAAGALRRMCFFCQEPWFYNSMPKFLTWFYSSMPKFLCEKSHRWLAQKSNSVIGN